MPQRKTAKLKPPRKPSAQLSLARRGEDRAAEFLTSLGYKIIARNWRSSLSRNELDLVAEDGDCLVFVEVKTARTTKYGDPLTWITPQKQRAIIRAAEGYLSACQPSHSEIRFDAITIGAPEQGRDAPLTHTISAFVAETD